MKPPLSNRQTGSHSRPIGAVLCIAAVAILMCGQSVLFLATAEGNDVDLLENRRLTSFPKPTISTISNGHYARTIEEYVNDRFPFRNELLDAGYWLKDIRGLAYKGQKLFHSAKGHDALEGWVTQEDLAWAKQDATTPGGDEIIGRDGEEPPSINLPEKANSTSSKKELPATNQSSRLDRIPQGGTGAGPVKKKVVSPSKPKNTGQKKPVKKLKRRKRGVKKAENLEGILIYDGRAIELSGGLLSSAGKYAKILNSLRQKLDKSISIASIMVPTAIAVHAPPNYRRAMRHSRRVVADVGTHLESGIHAIDGYQAMAPYSHEYLYFRTDHHWTALGAFHVYTEYAKKLGLAPIPKLDWGWKEGRSFLGTLYGITRAPSLKKNRDNVAFPNPKVSHTARRYSDGWSKRKKGIKMRFVNPTYRGYGVFLGGDFPLVVGQTSVKNGRRVILIKNSYGNAFAPFLLPHFETVAVLDYRYFEGRLSTLINDLELTDIVFLNTNSHISSGFHRRRLKRLLRIPKGWVRTIKSERSVDEASAGSTPADSAVEERLAPPTNSPKVRSPQPK